VPFWTFWQYTATGRVAGVTGNVDRNNFNGTRARLIALANNTA
jgi:GH25 family lysozyme M1 (1,4-beta-N-acetylmuramidase)